jgi:high-affinity nickel-transport protein
LGVLFGLGFDTSSEIALLGISSIQAVQGTSIWLIMIFPILFTAGMCLIDTTDGGLMLTLYTWHDNDDLDVKIAEGSTEQLSFETESQTRTIPTSQGDLELGTTTIDLAEADAKIKHPESDETEIPSLDREETTTDAAAPALQPRKRQQDPLIFLYYSTILTGVTVIVALVIGVIQLLSLILNVAEPTGKFWDGVAVAGDHYDVIGGSICGLFLVVGVAAIFFYSKFRRWVYATRERNLAAKEVQQWSSDAEVALEAGLVDAEDGPGKAQDVGGVATNELLYEDRAR